MAGIISCPDRRTAFPEKMCIRDSLEAVQDVDTWLGFFLKDRKEKGLDDNTIIFFFSDHGGCVPRGKGYL